MRKIIVLFTLLMLAILSLTGCAKKEVNTQKEAPKEAQKQEFAPAKNPLADVMILKGHPVHRIVQLGFLEKAKELGYPAEILANDGSDPAESVALGEAGIGKGIKGMMVWAFNQSYYPFIKKAHDAGVKVVVPHFPIKEGDAPGLDANLSADPFKYGQEVAKAIGEKIGGKGKVAITQGSFNITENAAAEGFKKYMQEHYPNVKVLDPIEEGFDPAIAISRAVAIIQANPDLAGAFSTTGGGPTTWAGAKDQTGKKDIVAIGMDYTEENIDLVKSGKIYAIVAQPLYEEAARSVEILDKLLRGEKVPYFTPLEAPVVTKEGINKYESIIARVKAFAFK